MVDCMVATKTPAAKAERLAANLLAADYRGHFSHGLNRLAHYVKGGTVDICSSYLHSLFFQGSDFVPFLMYAGYQIRQLRSLRGADSAERVRGHGLGRRKQRARSDRRRILVSWLRG